jgi:hypothetical protein
MGVLGFFIPAIMNLERDAPNAAPGFNLIYTLAHNLL